MTRRTSSRTGNKKQETGQNEVPDGNDEEMTPRGATDDPEVRRNRRRSSNNAPSTSTSHAVPESSTEMALTSSNDEPPASNIVNRNINSDEEEEVDDEAVPQNPNEKSGSAALESFQRREMKSGNVSPASSKFGSRPGSGESSRTSDNGSDFSRPGIGSTPLNGPSYSQRPSGEPMPSTSDLEIVERKQTEHKERETTHDEVSEGDDEEYTATPSDPTLICEFVGRFLQTARIPPCFKNESSVICSTCLDYFECYWVPILSYGSARRSRRLNELKRPQGYLLRNIGIRPLGAYISASQDSIICDWTGRSLRFVRNPPCVQGNPINICNTCRKTFKMKWRPPNKIYQIGVAVRKSGVVPRSRGSVMVAKSKSHATPKVPLICEYSGIHLQPNQWPPCNFDCSVQTLCSVCLKFLQENYEFLKAKGWPKKGFRKLKRSPTKQDPKRVPGPDRVLSPSPSELAPGPSQPTQPQMNRPAPKRRRDVDSEESE
ncbi:hypothetical protein GCK72_015196 [Caenorhabditis remanei]|uniref:Uncharacterized protein n=1 Tax=Caenorhabditis remanei TaxID=31234 RepID=A0A6A5GVV6_CAERE|nr:hypothetical protein GCK72_015196 [Caenorhabditis remanei]KAF1758736.1 hypothetical protein GCK72_015196 [Caenorhabditis remanei]